ncbi:hypothetical protein [Gracilibacillus kekensis]|uniref:Uncharacterized protein n=1 Tax=Gracilibacillus kekensis TaxID=1027249 RepID=A0A1M7ML47_9BACI|nr:hypothetical protein [Gracilibacillus kekensis]SHM91186.1 hypothetical protein SAMN05216179_1249 [Gracilibacillus kekensis]
MKVKLFIFSSIVYLDIVLIASANSSAIGNPTAREVLKANTDADIIQLDGLIYSNVTDNEWIKEQEYLLGDKIGEIKKQTKRKWFYRDYFATILPKGTAIYIRERQEYEKDATPFIVLVEKDGEILVYQAMVEG